MLHLYVLLDSSTLFNCLDNLIRSILGMESENRPLPDTVPAIVELMEYLSLVSPIHMAGLWVQILGKFMNIFSRSNFFFPYRYQIQVVRRTQR